MAKTKRTKANKSDQPLEDDFSAENLEPSFAVSDSKITVCRDEGKWWFPFPSGSIAAMAGR